jgi:hypothetical protein
MNGGPSVPEIEPPPLPKVPRRCPHCGGSLYEDVAIDGQLRFKPLVIQGYAIKGDWLCLQCERTLVNWTAYGEQLRRFELRMSPLPKPKRGRPFKEGSRRSKRRVRSDAFR